MGAHGSRYSPRLGSIPALLLTSLLLGTLPVGCGQRGPLYLPEDRPAGAGGGAAAAEPGSRADDAAGGDVRAGQSDPAGDSPDDDDRQR